MNTLLVPTDFSIVADNALQYAIDMAHHYHLEITLYHVVQFTPPNLSHVVYVDDTPQMTQDATLKLNEKKEKLQADYPQVPFHVRVDTGFLIESLKSVCNEIQPVAVVMGLTGSGTVMDQLVGSNAFLAMQNLHQPLFIIPKDAKFIPVERICFASDLRNVNQTTPSVAIRVFSKLFNAKLNILNVDKLKRASDPDALRELEQLKEMFSDIDYEFHFMEHENFQEALQQFIHDKDMQMVILLPKKYSWFESLFHKSQTKVMAYHSHVPLLALHMA
jgi:nucleotide-binding universal stress UspA family protein